MAYKAGLGSLGVLRGVTKAEHPPRAAIEFLDPRTLGDVTCALMNTTGTLEQQDTRWPHSEHRKATSHQVE